MNIPCFSCLTPNASEVCPACRVAHYCNKECQKAAWKAGHNKECRKCACVIKNDEETTGRGMYVGALPAGTVVFEEKTLLHVPFEEDNDTTWMVLARLAMRLSENWANMGFASNVWAAENPDTVDPNEDPEVTKVRRAWLDACNVMVTNGYNRTRMKGDITHKAFFVGGSFFNASGCPNAESIVTKDGDYMVLRVILHEDLEEGDQVYLGYEVDDCACAYCVSGTPCSTFEMSMTEKAKRLGINLSVLQKYDQEIYQLRLENLGAQLARMDELLSKEAMEAWVALNAPAMEHLKNI